MAPPSENPIMEKLSDVLVQLMGEDTKAKTICKAYNLRSCGADSGESE